MIAGFEITRITYLFICSTSIGRHYARNIPTNLSCYTTSTARFHWSSLVQNNGIVNDYIQIIVPSLKKYGITLHSQINGDQKHKFPQIILVSYRKTLQNGIFTMINSSSTEKYSFRNRVTISVNCNLNVDFSLNKHRVYDNKTYFQFCCQANKSVVNVCIFFG